MDEKGKNLCKLAVLARQGLETGDDTYFNQLRAALNDSRNHFLKYSAHKYPSVDPHDAESLYDECIWLEVLEFDEAEKLAYRQKLNQRAYTRVVDIIRRRQCKERMRDKSLNEICGDNVAGHYDTTELRLPNSPSAEEEFFAAFIESDVAASVSKSLADAEELGPYARAAIRLKIEQDIPHNEIVNLAPDLFRNRQQFWRAFKKGTPSREEIIS